MVNQLSNNELVLETERLRLRPLCLEDVDLAKELFTDPLVMKFVGDLMPEEELQSETKMAVRRGAGGRIGVWCVTDRESGEKLGTSILLPLPVEAEDTDWSDVKVHSYPDGEVEIGYILKPSAWGKGIASEACGRLLRFAFENTELDEIVAVTDPGNMASQRILVKCGLTNEGLRRAYATNVTGFKITRCQWEKMFRAGSGQQ